MIPSELQPDQRPERWDDHVSVYEDVFEPFTLQFAEIAIAHLGATAGQAMIDVGAGSGGAALALAAQGADVTAVDASVKMCERIAARGIARRLQLAARVMDGQALQFADGSFDAALSVFGVVLFPNAVQGLAEMRRVVRPGGRVAVVTWTEPQSYELATEMRAATAAVRPDQPMAELPAQLRYRELRDFDGLFLAAGFKGADIGCHTALLRAPSAQWLGQRIGFAPGMAVQLDGLGTARDLVVDRLVRNLEARFGHGEVNLAAKAFVGSATVV